MRPLAAREAACEEWEAGGEVEHARAATANCISQAGPPINSTARHRIFTFWNLMDATYKIKSVSPAEPIASCVNANKSNYVLLLAQGIMASYPKAFYLNPKQVAPSKIQIEWNVTNIQTIASLRHCRQKIQHPRIPKYCADICAVK